MASTRGTAQGALLAGALVTALVGCSPERAGTPPPSPSVRLTGDGAIPDNGSISLSDTGHDALRGLDPALLEAVRGADVDARLDGVELRVTSGWRSHEYQQRLLDQAAVTYGSLTEARRFVNTPERSTHVSGKAIDIGPTAADDWLIRHGAAYGLCQAYANEMWHFELLTTPGGECPPPRADATD
ncbi:M15 family metallopeptidase [Umezawaea sp.]|uniref:M15 family metallopeptidase n=1 Tax=Umezawaea sp. TaxID=1955258 RepID=UPI002ED4FA9E